VDIEEVRRVAVSPFKTTKIHFMSLSMQPEEELPRVMIPGFGTFSFSPYKFNKMVQRYVVTEESKFNVEQDEK
jgi:hypothetical protein